MAGLPPVTIVTAASEAYARLVKGLVCSIRDAEAGQGPREPLPVRVIDLGLSDATVAELEADCQVLRKPEAPLAAVRTDLPREYLLSRAVKPLIRDYFPGHEVYLWLDSDAWVQNAWAIDLLCYGARMAGLAVVPELDRSYIALYRKDSPHFQEMFAGLEESFGRAVAQHLAGLPLFNSGVWAARADSPIWECWPRRLEVGFRAARRRVRDQPAFNVALYADNISFCPLSSLCNWLCGQALPRAWRRTLRLTEPLPPFQEIGILHLTAGHWDRELPVPCDEAGTLPLKLDYLSLREMRRTLAS